MHLGELLKLMEGSAKQHSGKRTKESVKDAIVAQLANRRDIVGCQDYGNAVMRLTREMERNPEFQKAVDEVAVTVLALFP